MPRVPVRLPSSSSCICMRRTPRADPGTRGRNRPRPQPSLLEAPRTGGACWWGSNRLQRRLGGSGDCSPPFLCGSMRGAHTPITEGITWRVLPLLAPILHYYWFRQYGRGTGNELARYCSRNTLTPLSHAYLVKTLRLLPGPGEG